MQDSRNAYEHLSADEDDAAHYVRRRSPTISTFYRNVMALLMFIGVSGYGLLHYSGALKSQPHVTASVQPQALLQTQKVAVSRPAPEPLQTRQSPQPLADCIRPDNLINNAVATCRFGQFPETVRNTNARGMVSDEYMAQYKSDQQTPQTRRTKIQSVEWASFQQWDKKRAYRAAWNITDNRIEGSSVCMNFSQGSIEYRECRKGAKVYFRDQCKSWRKKWEATNTDSSKAALQRYCSADNGFNPLG